MTSRTESALPDFTIFMTPREHPLATRSDTPNYSGRVRISRGSTSGTICISGLTSDDSLAVSASFSSNSFRDLFVCIPYRHHHLRRRRPSSHRSRNSSCRAADSDFASGLSRWSSGNSLRLATDRRGNSARSNIDQNRHAQSFSSLALFAYCSLRCRSFARRHFLAHSTRLARQRLRWGGHRLCGTDSADDWDRYWLVVGPQHRVEKL